MSHAGRVVIVTWVASSGSADQVSTISTTDLADSGRFASFERIDISLSIRETGMKPSPSRQRFTPEFVWPYRSREGQAGGRTGFFFCFLILEVQSSQAPYRAWLTFGSFCYYRNSFPASKTSLPWRIKRRLERSRAISRHFCGSNVVNSQDKCLVLSWAFPKKNLMVWAFDHACSIGRQSNISEFWEVTCQ